jgi:hypothetical protein
LVERGPKRENNLIFPKDKNGNCFLPKQYYRNLPNGEMQDRKWLVYSVSTDKVLCFSCKLFTKKIPIGLLASEGLNDWHNIFDRLKSHERSTHHIESNDKMDGVGKKIEIKVDHRCKS